MIEISGVRLPLDAGCSGVQGQRLLRVAGARALGISERELKSVSVLRRSVDARKKGDVHFVATLGVCLVDDASEKELLAKPANKGGVGSCACLPKSYLPAKRLPLLEEKMSRFSTQSVAFGNPPVVVGTGPAGLFCALYLARAGLSPVVIERGGSVDERQSAISILEATGHLDLQTNIQFGEGGAGTFSDGKLTTNIKNKQVVDVLHCLVDAGAPAEILWQAKPHIGTDLLAQVVVGLRRRIIEAGGHIYFHTCANKFYVEGGSVVSVGVYDTKTGRSRCIDTRQVVLACGHSARDTFEALREAGVSMEQKPFAVGLRIEHLQSFINRAQYGDQASHGALGAAEYKLSHHFKGGRGVYTFCMCPGGEVVCAASEEQGMVVNGMSRFARDGVNANSALLVSVNPRDFKSDHPLAGVVLQRQMERDAYQLALSAGGAPYQAPAQSVGSFLSHAASTPSTTVVPSYARGVVWCDLHQCLPPFVAEALSGALPVLDRKLPGFADAHAVMTGVETRSSSPVRITRDAQLQALFCAGDSVKDGYDRAYRGRGSGLYPCGEGAGYAGGIVSAACDGLRVAQMLCQESEKQ